MKKLSLERKEQIIETGLNALARLLVLCGVGYCCYHIGKATERECVGNGIVTLWEHDPGLKDHMWDAANSYKESLKD